MLSVILGDAVVARVPDNNYVNYVNCSGHVVCMERGGTYCVIQLDVDKMGITVSIPVDDVQCVYRSHVSRR